jgi:hypothetical protein
MLRVNVSTLQGAPQKLAQTCHPVPIAQLKLAIDAALLPTSDSSLLSSYLQVLIMSEGDAFLHKTIHEIALTLRATETDPGARPVSEAERIVKVFCTKELKTFQGFREGQLGVQQYIANATMDLVIMAEWRLVADLLGLDPLPVRGWISVSAEVHPANDLRNARHTPSPAINGHSRCSPRQ